MVPQKYLHYYIIIIIRSNCLSVIKIVTKNVSWNHLYHCIGLRSLLGISPAVSSVGKNDIEITFCENHRRLPIVALQVYTLSTFKFYIKLFIHILLL